MLIDRITDFSKNKYDERRSDCRCENCNHPTMCPKDCDDKCNDCKICLEQIHYHNSNGKTDYDCPNMINYYVCCYTFKYASEILYLAMKSDLINEISEYNILSFGCGACPDLMAFEKYNECDGKYIRYRGIDMNRLWDDIHTEISDYANVASMEIHYTYDDAINIVRSPSISNINIIVLQYFISHLYNTNQINGIDEFFNNLIMNVISNNTNNEPIIIMINDVNSINCGREHFISLYNKLKTLGYDCTYKMFYFDYHDINDYQRYGTKHVDNRIIFNVPDDFANYHLWKRCTSAQLLIEIKRG